MLKNTRQSYSANVGAPASVENPNLTLSFIYTSCVVEYYLSQTNQIVATRISPIMSVPSSMAMPNPTVPSSADMICLLPNYGLTYTPQVTPGTSIRIPPMTSMQATLSTL